MPRRTRKVDDSAGELNMVPYLDIVTNLVLFLLQVSAVAAALCEVPLRMPTVGPAPPSPTPADPLLTVVVGTEGFSVAGAGGVLPGPQGHGPTIPRIVHELDRTALTRLMRQLKDALPNQTRAYVVAEDGVPLGEVVATLDAMRESGKELLFPDVTFGGF